MPTYNTTALKEFAQQTRAKLVSLIETKIKYLLNTDDIASKTYKSQIDSLRKAIGDKTEKVVVEEVAYTWFNRIMALRFMDANGYNSPMVVSYAEGQTRPEILQEALAGNIDSNLGLPNDVLMLSQANLYRRLLVASCNHFNGSMPFLFERITDYTELLLPDDLLSIYSFVSDIRNGMTDSDCENVELMGWLYQFYIIDRKKEAEENKKRTGGLKSDEQAAATQLFTPHWIVRYMVENSLGRIWMTLHPDSKLIKDMPYYIKPADGEVDCLPEGINSASDIRFLDPCMGSGHILVYAFDLFVRMYEEEGKITKDIPALIMQNNLFGIDIDSRCYQLASFALTMKARAYYSRYLRNAVVPNVIALQVIDRNTIASTGKWPSNSLMWNFENVDTIGSLLRISPSEYSQIHVEEGIFAERQNLLKKQAEYLSRKYHCVVTNPPYLGKGIGEELKNYIQQKYPNSKADTMATFMEHCCFLCENKGKVAMINMQSWMFQSSYKKLRNELVEHISFKSLLHLGSRAFDEIGGEVVQCATFVIDNIKPNENTTADYFRLVDLRSSEEKKNAYLDALSKPFSGIVFPHVCQTRMTLFPDVLWGYWVSDNIVENLRLQPMKEFGQTTKGIITGKNSRFIRLWFELNNDEIKFDTQSVEDCIKSGFKWFPCNKGGGFRKWYGNNDYVIDWFNDGNHVMTVAPNEKRHAQDYYSYMKFKPVLSWSSVSSIPNFRVKMNDLVEHAGMAYYPKNQLNILYYLGLFSSVVAKKYLEVFSPGFNMNAGDIDKLPFNDKILADSSIAELVKECIDISQQDWDAHETSWNFSFNALVKQMKTENNVGICLDKCLKNLVQDYKNEWIVKFHKLKSNEELLNEKMINIYGLQRELLPNISLNEVSILQKGEISIENNQIVWHDDVIIKQLLSYLVGCLMGRYSVMKPGLIIASQNVNAASVNGVLLNQIDEDGIIPMALQEDVFPDEMTQKVELLVKSFFGTSFFYENIEFIKNILGCSLREYFYNNFFEDHLQLYSVKGVKRPIYWLFNSSMGDKRKKGYFKALVYMHRIDCDTLSRLHSDYVHPYLKRLELQLKEYQEQSLQEDLSSKSKNQLISRIENQQSMVREIREYEQCLIEMASSRITIDLDDGVKANYPKFYPLVETIKGLDSEDDE